MARQGSPTTSNSQDLNTAWGPSLVPRKIHHILVGVLQCFAPMALQVQSWCFGPPGPLPSHHPIIPGQVAPRSMAGHQSCSNCASAATPSSFLPFKQSILLGTSSLQSPVLASVRSQEVFYFQNDLNVSFASRKKALWVSFYYT